MDYQEKIRLWFIRKYDFAVGLKILQSMKAKEDLVKSLIQINNVNPLAACDGLKDALRAFGSYDDSIPVNINKFEFKLGSIKDISVIEPQPPDTSQPPTQIPPAKGYKIFTLNEPLNIQLLRAKSIGLLKERSLLHTLMGDEAEKGNDKKAYKLARIILEILTPEIGDIYEKIKAWEESTVIPDTPLSNEFKKGVQIILKKESLRTRIARIKRELKTNTLLSESEVKEYHTELESKKLKLLEIDKIVSLTR